MVQGRQFVVRRGVAGVPDPVRVALHCPALGFGGVGLGGAEVQGGGGDGDQ